MSRHNLNKNLLYFIILLNYCISITFALHCYTCTYVAPDKDQSCINNPSAVPGRNIISCPKKYCTTLRQETVSPAGKVVTFLRDCQDKPQYLNEEKEDSTHKFYYRSCRVDLCNSGNGISSVDAASSDGGAGENMIVPGRSKSFIMLPSNLLIFIIILLIFFNKRFI